MYQNFLQVGRLVDEGLNVGQVEGEGKTMGWCVANSGHQFLTENELESQIKIEGFTVGCLQVATDTDMLCEHLPSHYDELTESDPFTLHCGKHGICKTVFESAVVFCDSQE